MNIKGMHCKGCSSLIKMSLEDAGLQDINIDLDSKTGTFSGSDVETETQATVARTFTGLPGYGYQDLKAVK